MKAVTEKVTRNPTLWQDIKFGFDRDFMLACIENRKTNPLADGRI